MPPSLELTHRSFMLRDPDYGVAYEGFQLHLVKEGSVVEVRDCVLEGEAEAAAADARAVQAELAVGPEEYFFVDAKPAKGRRKKAPSEFSESDVSDVSGSDNVSSEDDEDGAKKEARKATPSCHRNT